MTFTLDDAAAVDGLLRDVAARIILPRFGRLALSDIASKSAVDDLVTIADTEAEAALAKGLRALFPGCAVTGEEMAVDGFDYSADPLLFVIDPVDGTWPFAHGLPVFGSMIAVLVHGRPMGGIIHYPVLGDSLMTARGAGVHRVLPDGQTEALPPLSQDGRVQTGLLPLSLFNASQRRRMIASFDSLPRIVTIQCSAHEYRMLAEGQADFSVSARLKPWDHHAGQLMLAELGGFAAMQDGTPWTGQADGPLISARNRATFDAVVRMMA